MGRLGVCRSITLHPSIAFSAVPSLTSSPALSSSSLFSSSLSSSSSPFFSSSSFRFFSSFRSNITSELSSKINIGLHRRSDHPIALLRERIESYFLNEYKNDEGESIFKTFYEFNPKVSVKDNFDDLLIPKDHVSRRLTDTFYYNETELLRTHTSAHQNHLIRSGVEAFLCTGDCYRRDEIDASHYPIFHQMEGVQLFDMNKIISNLSPEEKSKYINEKGEWNEKEIDTFVSSELKKTLEGLMAHLFGASTQMRWIDAYFPFTNPSFELEIYYQNRWLEVLGCGNINKQLLKNCSLPYHKQGWAFGIGLERIAMVLFNIPDIRLFWSNDERFLSQFNKSKPFPIEFKPFSKYPPCPKDISFWLPENNNNNNSSSSSPSSSSSFHENDLCDIIRSIAGDLVESVTLQSTFIHPKTKKESRLYRIIYRSFSRSLTNEEIDKLQFQVRQQIAEKLKVELR